MHGGTPSSSSSALKHNGSVVVGVGGVGAGVGVFVLLYGICMSQSKWKDEKFVRLFESQNMRIA